MKLYRVSDYAYEHLRELAAEHNYIRADAKTSVGMSDFVTRLSNCTFEDTRPHPTKRLHEMEQASDHRPKWQRLSDAQDSIRRNRGIQLQEDTEVQFVRIALQFGIIGNYRIGNDIQIKHFTAVTALVLEAVGLGWLTPTNLRFNTKPNKQIQKATSARTPTPPKTATPKIEPPKLVAPPEKELSHEEKAVLLIEFNEWRAGYGLPPIAYISPKKQRSITITNEAYKGLLTLSFKYAYLSRRTNRPSASAILECLGLGFLTLTEAPPDSYTISTQTKGPRMLYVSPEAWSGLQGLAVRFKECAARGVAVGQPSIGVLAESVGVGKYVVQEEVQPHAVKWHELIEELELQERVMGLLEPS